MMRKVGTGGPRTLYPATIGRRFTSISHAKTPQCGRFSTTSRQTANLAGYSQARAAKQRTFTLPRTAKNLQKAPDFTACAALHPAAG
ncbi:hypothetical protein [Bradyrhizobium sp. UFLA05-112]|jgi:hypothetical protein